MRYTVAGHTNAESILHEKRAEEDERLGRAAKISGTSWAVDGRSAELSTRACTHAHIYIYEIHTLDHIDMMPQAQKLLLMY